MNFSKTEISFLNDVPSDITVDMTSGWRFHFFHEVSIYNIATFIKTIPDDKIYLIIPLLSGSKSISKATLNLSDPFLINNRSDCNLILKFIIDQWDNSGFTVKLDKKLDYLLNSKEFDYLISSPFFYLNSCLLNLFFNITSFVFYLIGR